MSATHGDLEKIQSVSASEGVTRSRHSSVWPIPFYGQLLTSQSGTVAGPREESSLRGTEAICLCSGPVGRSHTATGKRIARKKGRERREGGGGRGKKSDSFLGMYFQKKQHG